MVQLVADARCRKYALYMEGYDVEEQAYCTTLLDTGVTEWFDIVKE